MELYLDTSESSTIKIAIKKDDLVLFEKSLEAKYQQSEKLLIAIDDLLTKNNVKLVEIKKIIVKESGEGFSSLRIGVVTANALAYGLGIPVEGITGKSIELGSFNIVKPEYNSEPNIGAQLKIKD